MVQSHWAPMVDAEKIPQKSRPRLTGRLLQLSHGGQDQVEPIHQTQLGFTFLHLAKNEELTGQKCYLVGVLTGIKNRDILGI